MTRKLFIQALMKYFLGVIIVGLLLFVPANSIHYWNAWLFMGILFIPMFIVGIIMMFKNPNLLMSRLNAKEKEHEQKEVLLCSGIMFILGFIFAGLNYQFKWMYLSNYVVIISTILFIISYILYAEVLRENAYLYRTIEVKNGQKVVNSGLYGIVRHPMYAITIVLFLTMPLILGSIISFGIFLIYPFIIIKRIKNEEQVLEKDLPGYIEYEKKVKFRLIPFIW